MTRRYLLCLIVGLSIAVLPGFAHAVPVLGTGQLISVTPVDGGCVSGPTGPAVQAWDVEPGKTYTLTISNVTDCANGGTDPTLNVRVNSTDSGNTDIVATQVAVGVYQFNYTLPAMVACTMAILYCTTPGGGGSGLATIGPGSGDLFVRRSDGGAFQAHLRAATFDAGCTNPQSILGPDCGATPAPSCSWGRLKTIYR